MNREDTEHRLLEWSEWRSAHLDGFTGVEEAGTSVLGRLIDRAANGAPGGSGGPTGGPTALLALRYGSAIKRMGRVARVERVYQAMPEEYQVVLQLAYLEGRGRTTGCEELGLSKGEWYKLLAEALGYVRARLTG